MGTKGGRTQRQSETRQTVRVAGLPPGVCHKQSVSGVAIQRVRNPLLVKTRRKGRGAKQSKGNEEVGQRSGVEVPATPVKLDLDVMCGRVSVKEVAASTKHQLAAAQPDTSF